MFIERLPDFIVKIGKITSSIYSVLDRIFDIIGYGIIFFVMGFIFGYILLSLFYLPRRSREIYMDSMIVSTVNYGIRYLFFLTGFVIVLIIFYVLLMLSGFT